MLYWTGAVLLEKYKQKEGMLWLIILVSVRSIQPIADPYSSKGKR